MSNKSTEKTINQHYVPRMYIKRFGYGEKDNPRISVLKKETGKILHNQNPENFASKRFFYDVPKETLEQALETDFRVFPDLQKSEWLDDEQFIEHALSREEEEYKNILDTIEREPLKIYEDRIRAIFITFVHELAYRTRKFRNNFDSIYSQTEAWLSDICDGMNLDESTKRKTIEENCVSGKDIQMRKMISIGETLQTMKMLLKNYNWYIGINNTKLDFVISDNPAQTIWMGFNDICIPVSKRIAIILRVISEDAPMICIDKAEDNVINMSVKGMVAYNSLQLSMAQMYVFGSKEAITFMKNINNLLEALDKKSKNPREYWD